MKLLKQKQSCLKRSLRFDLEELKQNCEQLLSEMDEHDGFLHSENLLLQNNVLTSCADRKWAEVKLLEDVKDWREESE